MSPSPAESEDVIPDRDELLAGWLERLIDEARQGRSPDVDAMSAEQPALRDELNELWATVRVAEGLASEAGGMASRAGGMASGGRQSPDRGGSPETCSALPGASGDLRPPLARGDYELLEEIGRGGMGIVYRAQQRSLNRTVVVKMILRGELASETDLARFRVEAEASARLEHPHIVKVYEVGVWDGQPFFSMQFIDGITLSERLADGPLSGKEAARLLIPICRAIGHAHQQGVLHRDLKPSNVLIDREGRSFVTDFGLAKRVRSVVSGPLSVASGGRQSASGGRQSPDGGGSPNAPNTLPGESGGSHLPLTALTQSGAILGTPGYMAPEQAIGSRGAVDSATDVYSLGAILYAMLTGRAPFQAASPVDVVLMVLEQDPPPPRLLNPSADPDLEMIALKALQKPADLRYATADALADDLEAYLSGDPIAARSSHFSQILSRAFRQTHHIGVMQNWGLLWMWHSLVLLVLCLVTNAMQWQGVNSRLPYLALWTVGLGTWALIFWNLRRRSGPVTFVERQIAHVWAGSMACSTMLYAVEWLLDLPVLSLSPVLPLIAGAVFIAKAGILSGEFYVHAAAMFATCIPMALYPDWGLTVFGIVSALTFFVPGLKFHRQRIEGNRSVGI